MGENCTDWYIIINPLAGSGKTMQSWEKAEKRLRKLGVGYTVVTTEYAGHAVRLAARAAEKGYRRFLAVGGDGSVHELFCGLMNVVSHMRLKPEDFTLGVIPIGTGNDWIRSLDIPGSVDGVVKLVAKKSFHYQDIVCMRGADGKKTYMANIGGTGFDSMVCQKVNSEKVTGRRSPFLYVKALIQTVIQSPIINVEVLADGKSIFKGRCYSISFGNGPYSGGGMRQTSAADMNDGKLDVMIVPVLSLITIATNIYRFYTGTTHKCRHVVYSQCKNLKVLPLDRDSEVIFEADGEIEGHLPLEISMLDTHMKVVSKKRAI